MVGSARHLVALLVIAGLAIVSLACAAQTGTPEQVEVTISCDEFQQRHEQTRSFTGAASTEQWQFDATAGASNTTSIDFHYADPLVARLALTSPLA